jgi:hypothetical protein
MSLNHKLRRIAELLPDVPVVEQGKIMTEKVLITMTGAEILEKKPDYKLKNGESPEPKKSYRILHSVPKKINHFEVMCRFKKQGINAINQYIRFAFEYNQIPLPESILLEEK